MAAKEDRCGCPWQGGLTPTACLAEHCAACMRRHVRHGAQVYTEVTDVSFACPFSASPVKREWHLPACEAYGSRWWKRRCGSFLHLGGFSPYFTLFTQELTTCIRPVGKRRRKVPSSWISQHVLGWDYVRRRFLKNILLTLEAHEQRATHLLPMAHVSFRVGHAHLLCSRRGGLQGNVLRTSWCVHKAPAKQVHSATARGVYA